MNQCIINIDFITWGKNIFAPWQISYDNKIAAGGLILSRNLPRETIQRETLFHGTLDALLLWPNIWQSVPEMCYIFANISQTPTLILNLTIPSESQWNVDSNDILSIHKYCQFFMYESNTFLWEKYAILPIQTNGAQMLINPQNSPFFLGHVNPI